MNAPTADVVYRPTYNAGGNPRRYHAAHDCPQLDGVPTRPTTERKARVRFRPCTVCNAVACPNCKTPIEGKYSYHIAHCTGDDD